MARTKGSTNKNVSNKPKTDDGEPKVTKPRGRQKGQKIEKEPVVIVEIDKNNRVKLDKIANIWQQKGKEDNPEVVEEGEDKGWKLMGYYPSGVDGMAMIAKKYRDDLIKQKAKKEEIITVERYMELADKVNNAVIKIFTPMGLTITKNK